MSLEPGWTMVSAIAVAIAASTALPPARRMRQTGGGGERLAGGHDARAARRRLAGKVCGNGWHATIRSRAGGVMTSPAKKLLQTNSASKQQVTAPSNAYTAGKADRSLTVPGGDQRVERLDVDGAERRRAGAGVQREPAQDPRTHAAGRSPSALTIEPALGAVDSRAAPRRRAGPATRRRRRPGARYGRGWPRRPAPSTSVSAGIAARTRERANVGSSLCGSSHGCRPSSAQAATGLGAGRPRAAAGRTATPSLSRRPACRRARAARRPGPAPAAPFRPGRRGCARAARHRAGCFAAAASAA